MIKRWKIYETADKHLFMVSFFVALVVFFPFFLNIMTLLQGLFYGFIEWKEILLLVSNMKSGKNNVVNFINLVCTSFFFHFISIWMMRYL